MHHLFTFAKWWIIASGVTINLYVARDLLYYGAYRFSQWRWNRKFKRPS